MKDFIKKLLKFLQINCPECGGRMKNDDVHITKHGIMLEVYTCKMCGKQWI